MKALVKALANDEEIVKANNMALPTPKPEWVYVDFYFVLSDIRLAFVLPDGDVKIFILGHWQVLRLNNETWERILDHFKHV